MKKFISTLSYTVDENNLPSATLSNLNTNTGSDVFNILYKSLIECYQTSVQMDVVMTDDSNGYMVAAPQTVSLGATLNLKLCELNETYEVIDYQFIQVKITEVFSDDLLGVYDSYRFKVIGEEKAQTKYISNTTQAVIYTDTLGWELVYPLNYTKDKFSGETPDNHINDIDFYVVKPKIPTISNCLVVRRLKDRMTDTDEILATHYPHGATTYEYPTQWGISEDIYNAIPVKDRLFIQLIHLYDYDTNITLDENIQKYEVQNSSNGYRAIFPNISFGRYSNELNDFEDNGKSFDNGFGFIIMMPDKRDFFIYGDEKEFIFALSNSTKNMSILSFGVSELENGYTYKLQAINPAFNSGTLSEIAMYSLDNARFDNMGAIDASIIYNMTYPDDTKFSYSVNRIKTVGDANKLMTVQPEEITKITKYDVYLDSDRYSFKYPFTITNYPLGAESEPTFFHYGKRLFVNFKTYNQFMTLELELGV